MVTTSVEIYHKTERIEELRGFAYKIVSIEIISNFAWTIPLKNFFWVKTGVMKSKLLSFKLKPRKLLFSMNF